MHRERGWSNRYANDAWHSCIYCPSKFAAHQYMQLNKKMENIMNFKSSMERIAGAFSTPSRQQIERAYLNKSVSITDLERRQNEIARGKFYNI